MSSHDELSVMDEMTKWIEFAMGELVFVFVNGWQLEMRVKCRISVSREMLDAADDARLMKGTECSLYVTETLLRVW